MSVKEEYFLDDIESNGWEFDEEDNSWYSIKYNFLRIDTKDFFVKEIMGSFLIVYSADVKTFYVYNGKNGNEIGMIHLNDADNVTIRSDEFDVSTKNGNRITFIK